MWFYLPDEQQHYRDDMSPVPYASQIEKSALSRTRKPTLAGTLRNGGTGVPTTWRSAISANVANYPLSIVLRLDLPGDTTTDAAAS